MSWNLLRKLRVRYIRARVGKSESVPMCDCAVVVAPHPDDEVFGCAGVMSRLKSEGKHVELIVMTGGGKSHADCCDIDEDELIEKRRELTKKAAEIYGVDNICFLDFTDGNIHDVYEVKSEELKMKTTCGKFQTIEHEVANEIQCQLLREKLMKLGNEYSTVGVFVPHETGEGWSDHVETNRIVRRIVDEMMPGVKIFEYCVWFWFYGCLNIDWKQAKVVRLSNEEYRKKQEAIHVYMDVLAPCGKPWSGNLPKMFMWAMKWKMELFFIRHIR